MLTRRAVLPWFGTMPLFLMARAAVAAAPPVFAGLPITFLFPPFKRPKELLNYNVGATVWNTAGAHHCPSFHTGARREFRCGRFFLVIFVRA